MAVKMSALNQRGMLSVPMSLVLVTAVTATLGTGAIMHRWRELTKLQLRLDHCVGRAAHDFKTAEQEIEDLNGEIRVTRAAILAGSALPPAVAALKVALTALSLKQTLTQVQWTAKRAAWATRITGCREFWDQATELPDLQWISLPPDQVGPLPLRWPPGITRDFYIAIHRKPRAAVARVFSGSERTKTDAILFKSRWHIRWSNPAELLRANFH